MHQSDVREIAEGLMFAHGLTGWGFGFNTRRNAVAVCDYRRKSIFFSEHFTEKTDDREIVNVILHEIAHALCGSEYVNGRWIHHGAKWRAIAKSIGCTGDRCSHTAVSTAEAKAPKFYMRCDSCGEQWPAFRERKYPLTQYRTRCCGSTISRVSA